MYLAQGLYRAVQQQSDQGRLPERVEVTACYVVSEALANAAKHAEAGGPRRLGFFRGRDRQAEGRLSNQVNDRASPVAPGAAASQPRSTGQLKGRIIPSTTEIRRRSAPSSSTESPSLHGGYDGVRGYRCPAQPRTPSARTHSGRRRPGIPPQTAYALVSGLGKRPASWKFALAGRFFAVPLCVTLSRCRRSCCGVQCATRRCCFRMEVRDRHLPVVAAMG
jgi:hypothetical protein